jgi:hypothetical protein
LLACLREIVFLKDITLPALRFDQISPSSAIRAAVGRKCLEIKPRPEKVCTTTPQLASLPEAVIRGGGCSGRVSFN